MELAHRWRNQSNACGGLEHVRYLATLTIATTLFGQSVSDPYRYLEDAHSARTQQWIDAQNTQAERIIDAYSGNARIARRVAELSLTGARQFDAQLAGNTLFFMREVPPQPQPVLVAQSWPQGTPRVVLDPATLGPAVSIDFVWPSPNGRLLAVGIASGGSESTSIRVARNVKRACLRREAGTGRRRHNRSRRGVGCKRSRLRIRTSSRQWIAVRDRALPSYCRHDASARHTLFRRHFAGRRILGF